MLRIVDGISNYITYLDHGDKSQTGCLHTGATSQIVITPSPEPVSQNVP
jgi:hypothetical protein